MGHSKPSLGHGNSDGDILVCFGAYPIRSLCVCSGRQRRDAKLAGINVNRIKIAVYVISGALSGLAGVILTARLNSAQPTAGIALELDAIAAVVLGGTSLSGGVGGIGGTLIGAFIMGVLAKGLNLAGVPSYYQQVIKGVVIVLAVVLDMATRRKNR